MDNALVIDGVLALVLLAGAIIGGVRGLFKSLMGLVVVLGAMIGAVVLAGMFTDPITDVIAPRVEEAVVREFSSALDQALQSNGLTASQGREKLTELLREYGLDNLEELLGPLADVLPDILNNAAGSLSELVGETAGSLKEQAAERFRGATASAIRALVRNMVHAVLILLLYPVLLFVLRLLVNLTDHAFDLPVLGTANTAGGAALGFLEAALLIYVLVFLATHLGVRYLSEVEDKTILLHLFLTYSPVDLLTGLVA